MSTAKKHEKFGVRGRLLVKGNKDGRITEKRCDGEENVDC